MLGVIRQPGNFHQMKKWLVSLVAIAGLVAVGWNATTPPSYHEPAEARLIGAVPHALRQADRGDVLASGMVSLAREVPGHDEILPLPGTDAVLVSGRDEWIWKVDATQNTAEKFALSPVSPTGARMVPGHPDQAYYCMARLDHNRYEHSPGLYVLDLNSRQFREVVTRVPVTGHLRDDGLEQPNAAVPDRVMVHPDPLKEATIAQLQGDGSRPLQFCNDLDVSKDGRYVYITEPFSHPKASSGLGAMPEGITLARNGRVWRYDTQTRSIGLVVENIVFADGILVEHDAHGAITGLLITETVNFRIGRANLAGPQRGSYDVLWDDLPGLPDGLDRDEAGRVWVALIKDRTPLMTWMHAHPWIKPALLRIPAQRLPPAKATGIIALSPDASRVLAYSRHATSKILDISVVVPDGDRLWLPSFSKHNTGIHYVPSRLLLGE